MGGGGVLINVVPKQAEGVNIYFVIYLEKIKKQSRTENLFGGTQMNKALFIGGIWYLTPLSTIFQLYRVAQYYWWRKPPTCFKSLTNVIT